MTEGVATGTTPYLLLSAIISAVNVEDGTCQEFVIGTCQVIDSQSNVLHLAHSVHRMDGGNALLVVGASIDSVLELLTMLSNLPNLATVCSIT